MAITAIRRSGGDAQMIIRMKMSPAKERPPIQERFEGGRHHRILQDLGLIKPVLSQPGSLQKATDVHPFITFEVPSDQMYTGDTLLP